MRVLPWVLCAISLAASAQSDAPFTLVCRVGDADVGYWEYNLRIDVQASIVNNRPATITDGEIKWSTDTQPTKTSTATINRYTGHMRVVVVDKTTQESFVYSGDCVRATERKF